MDLKKKFKSAAESVKSVGKQTVGKAENAMQAVADNDKVKVATETIQTVAKQTKDKADEAVQTVASNEKVKSATETVKAAGQKAVKATEESIQLATNDAKEKLNKERVAKYGMATLQWYTLDKTFGEMESAQEQIDEQWNELLGKNKEASFLIESEA